MSPDFSPERLADRMEIQHAVLKWCRGVDRKDWDLMREAFHPDATDNHGLVDGTVDSLVDYLTIYHSTVAQSMLQVSNCFIEFVNEDTAFVETYSHGWQKHVGAPVATRTLLVGQVEAAKQGDIYSVMMGRYVDRFERRAGAWRIARRDSVFEQILAEVIAHPVEIPEAWLSARRDGADLSDVRRRELGLTARPGG